MQIERSDRVEGSGWADVELGSADRGGAEGSRQHEIGGRMFWDWRFDLTPVAFPVYAPESVRRIRVFGCGPRERASGDADREVVMLSS